MCSDQLQQTQLLMEYPHGTCVAFTAIRRLQHLSAPTDIHKRGRLLNRQSWQFSAQSEDGDLQDPADVN
jgi:hypothetical protein